MDGGGWRVVLDILGGVRVVLVGGMGRGWGEGGSGEDG